jgi:hypothetical protein
MEGHLSIWDSVDKDISSYGFHVNFYAFFALSMLKLTYNEEALFISLSFCLFYLQIS